MLWVLWKKPGGCQTMPDSFYLDGFLQIPMRTYYGAFTRSSGVRDLTHVATAVQVACHRLQAGDYVETRRMVVVK
jgi:hypothetical protein